MNNTSNKTQCVWSDLSTLLFPGLLKEETDHTLITPILPNYTSVYLKAENALSELDTKELKELARKNLEISNKAEWGNIQGELDKQEDLKLYLEDIQNKLEDTVVDLNSKQDTISDLSTIRSNAALGASALQSVPEEYITETELNNKGYLTEHQDISGKLDQLVSGTNIKTINGNDILGTGNLVIESGHSLANIQAINLGESVDDVEIDFALKDEIPTNVSQLNNDSNYITEQKVQEAIGEVTSDMINAINSIEEMIVSVINTPT